jgi:hypothetical protein
MMAVPVAMAGVPALIELLPAFVPQVIVPMLELVFEIGVIVGVARIGTGRGLVIYILEDAG